MKAQQMFETLGYECRKSENAIQYLSECGKEIMFIFELHRFYKQRNFISLNIDIDEFKAIHQQMKELGWLEEEQKQETNLEHYFDDLLKVGNRFTFMNGKIESCDSVMCRKCVFCDDCGAKRFKWLASPYRNPTYKLTQCECDLLNAYKNSGMRQCISNYGTLLELYKKGYFKDIDTKIPIREILDNCEVIK